VSKEYRVEFGSDYDGTESFTFGMQEPGDAPPTVDIDRWVKLVNGTWDIVETLKFSLEQFGELSRIVSAIDRDLSVSAIVDPILSRQARQILAHLVRFGIYGSSVDEICTRVIETWLRQFVGQHFTRLELPGSEGVGK
jgi:hypothetical protein